MQVSKSDACRNKYPKFIYMLMESELVDTEMERDLEVVVENSLKMSTLCMVAVKRANSTLEIIIKGIENMASFYLFNVARFISLWSFSSWSFPSQYQPANPHDYTRQQKVI